MQTVYKIDIPNEGPTLPLPWYAYVGMTTKDPFDRMDEHKDNPKPYNDKFEILRQESDHNKWQLNILQQYNYHFKTTSDALKWLAPFEQQEIAKYHTYTTYKNGYGLNKTPGGDFGNNFYWKSNTSGVCNLWWHKPKQAWRFRLKDSSGNILIERNSKDLNKLIAKLAAENGIAIEDHIIDQAKYNASLAINAQYINN